MNAFPVFIKKKWHIEKKTSMQYKSNNGINVIFSTSVSFIYYNACIFFFVVEKTGSFDQILFTWAHNGLHTQLGCRWLHKPKQLIKQINLSVNIYSQPISHMRMESLLKMFPLKNDHF